MNHPSLKEKIEGMFLGGAIGDALGVPTEMRTQENIRENFGRITGFLPTRHNKCFMESGFTDEKSGYYSDDTVLTFATMKSLINARGFDMEDMVQEHLKAIKEWPHGFGRGTLGAIKRIEEGIHHSQSGQENGGGNGVIMKQSPLAAFAVIKNISEEDFEQNLVTYTRMTHGAPEATIVTLVHHRMLVALLHNTDGNIDTFQILTELQKYAKNLEQKYDISDLNKKLSGRISTILSLTRNEDGKITATDEQILKTFDWGERIGASCYVLTTFQIVYALFFRDQSLESLFDAINIGGDTDSYASILGNMIGALHGRFFPEDLITGVQGHEKLIQEVDEFMKIV